MKKIMFSDAFCLTQAVLNGTKTMTRRVLRDNVPLGNWEETKKHLPYKVGEVVAIAQPYKDIIECLPMYSNAILNEVGMPRKEYKTGWTNKMFVKADLLPHHIKNTDVKVERLRDISEEDALREGILKLASGYYYLPNGGDWAFSTPRMAFAYLIDKVSNKVTWESNPWVAAYSFELVD